MIRQVRGEVVVLSGPGREILLPLSLSNPWQRRAGRIVKPFAHERRYIVLRIEKVIALKVGRSGHFQTPELKIVFQTVGNGGVFPRMPPIVRIRSVVQLIMQHDEIEDFIVELINETIIRVRQRRVEITVGQMRIKPAHAEID